MSFIGLVSPFPKSLGMVLMSGCVMLNEELRQIGFKLSVGDVERKLVSRTTILG